MSPRRASRLAIAVAAGILGVSFPSTGMSEGVLPGHWEGAFSRQGSVQQVTLDLRRSPSKRGDQGGVAGTYDIPELGLFGERLDSLVATDTTLSFRLLYGVFHMRINALELQLTGDNRDWGPPVALHLRRAPESRCFDTVAVVVGRPGTQVRASLYLPRSRTKVPAVVVAGGSTQTTRGVWEYRSWGSVLAARGVAAVVYDRRGGSSDLDLKAEADDVLQLVAALKSRPEIDAARIGVLGMSRGGWVASWAAVASPNVKFLVLECAPAVSVTEQELQRIRSTEPTDSLNATDVQQAEAFGRQVMGAALGTLSWTALEPAIAQARTARWRDLVQIPERPADLDWWRRNEYDQAMVLERVHVPVLAMFGAADRLVPPAENADPMRQALAKGGNTHVTIEIVPRAPHGMYLFGHLVGDRWDWPAGYWAWAAKAPGVFERVGDWVLAR